MSVKYNGKHLAKFIRPEEYDTIFPQVELAHQQLESRSGAGNDFLGWLDLPVNYDKEEFARIKEAAKKIREDSDVLLVAGIGGSYLGARAVVEAVKGLYHNDTEDGLKIYFCGNTISPTYLNDIIKVTKGKRFSINVISKSGTTTETALAFRVLRKLLEDSVGPEEANKRIYATTDRAKGTLKQLADAQGWPTFVVPDDVGGRYSVLTAVGLLPIACAGIDIDALMKGAADAREAYSVCSKDNDAYRYAMTRNINYADESAETFVSVGTSGSLNPDGDIHCTLIEDPSGITSYNQKYKSSTEIQYQALPTANYNISSMNAVIRAGESYARIPVAIHPEGLHCDSLYALPLKMESCKEYPVAQAETVVLFAIKTYNNYSGYYNYIGTNNGASFSLIRNAVAVNKNTIRIYYTGTEELARAKDTGLTITVNEDNTLSLAGWKNLNVTEGSGSYDPQNKTFSFTCKVNGNEVEAYLISATASEE